MITTTLNRIRAHGDLFAENVPDAWIDRVFAAMALAPQNTFQVLTKRPERMHKYFQKLKLRNELIAIEAEEISGLDRFSSAQKSAWLFPLKNVWLGVSVEDQKRADERIPLLLETPAAVRWISAEPLLGPIDIQKYIERCHANRDGDCNAPSCPQKRDNEPYTSGRHCPIDSWPDFECDLNPLLDWVVAGGESGPNARPMNGDWVRSLRDQCATAGVPFFFKQWGGTRAKTAGRELDGATHNEMPEAK